jgi:hypothetical protein
VNETAARLDRALPAVRALLHGERIPFRFVDGVAVVHHGYARTTEDIDVLVDAQAFDALDDDRLAAHGFRRVSRSRLAHVLSAVRVDLLRSNEPIPRRPDDLYPSPASVAGSALDADFMALAPLLELKLLAGRYQDRADVVSLLKRLDDAGYLPVETAVRASLRAELRTLRRDALEELATER